MTRRVDGRGMCILLRKNTTLCICFRRCKCHARDPYCAFSSARSRHSQRSKGLRRSRDGVARDTASQTCAASAAALSRNKRSVLYYNRNSVIVFHHTHLVSAFSRPGPPQTSHLHEQLKFGFIVFCFLVVRVSRAADTSQSRLSHPIFRADVTSVVCCDHRPQLLRRPLTRSLDESALLRSSTSDASHSE
jgi:hypothetical protein